MSLSIDPLDVIEVQEPTIRIDQRKAFGVFKGGSDNIYYEYNANSSSQNQATWNINVPSSNIFIDRKIYLRSKLRLTFTGTTPDPSQNLLQSGFDAFRAYPLSNSMETLTIQVNNGAVSINMADVVQGLMRYVKNEDQQFEFSNSPNMLDQSQTYEELTGTQRNPLNYFGDSVYGAILPRGAFPVNVVSNTNTGAVIEADLVEPLMLSPLHFDKSLTNGFIGLEQLTAQINWNFLNGAKIWSHNNNSGSTISNIQVEFLQDPSLLVRTITPSELNRLEVPPLSVYGYHNIQRYTTVGSSVAPGVTRTIPTDTINLPVIPRRLFLFVKRLKGTETINTPDAFLSIERISINFANRSGLLASANKKDLYNISKKNGCNLTWSEWSGENMPFLSGSDNNVLNGVGSVLCLYMPEDIPLSSSDLLAPGVSDKTNLQITVDCKNNHPTETITPEVYLVVDTEGTFTVVNGMGNAQLGVLTKNDVLNARPMEGVNYEDVLDIYGGNFFRNVGSFIKKLPRYAMKGIDFLEKDILPIAKAVAPLLKMAGAGVEVVPQGGLITGGRRMNRSELKRRIKH